MPTRAHAVVDLEDTRLALLTDAGVVIGTSGEEGTGMCSPKGQDKETLDLFVKKKIPKP